MWICFYLGIVLLERIGVFRSKIKEVRLSIVVGWDNRNVLDFFGERGLDKRCFGFWKGSMEGMLGWV